MHKVIITIPYIGTDIGVYGINLKSSNHVLESELRLRYLVLAECSSTIF